MSSSIFKLSCSLVGHSLDVRCVAATNDNSILSGSRDKTGKLWKPVLNYTAYAEVMTYRDQKNFVASIIYIEPTKEYPDGLVITGGNDSTIFIYKPFELISVFNHKEHTNTVCCLSKGIDSNTFLSSSWDNSAKLWNLTSTHGSLATFTGHLAPVWFVIQLANSHIVTASADKTIGMWFKNGQQFKTLQGHTDCVRSLADFSELSYFASVSNDATIKLWSYAGETIDTLYGHTNYIYSIARNKAGGDNCFVTSDEDRTVRYWVNGVNTEAIQLPTQSVWSVCCLSNGDVVTGSSDGIVRIFTRDKSRYASEDVLKTYEDEVNALLNQTCQEIGGYKVSDLPGKEALYDPGKRAGQMKMIRESHGVVAYTWVEDDDNSHWEKVGDVLGGTDKKKEGKTMFEGEAYDFVFSVDVEDGKPPLKLPYNTGDDPYVAANKFLNKYMLPPVYLDQVVDFILKNSKTELPSLSSDYVDPFTGSSRYTPSNSVPSSVNQTGNNMDPFTGGSSYFTSSVGNKSATVGSDSSGFVPQAEYRTFDMGDPQVILTKLREFNQKFGDGSNKMGESLLESIVNLCKQSAPNLDCINALFKMLDWPDDLVFPVIDIVRLALRNEYNNSMICTRNNGAIVEKLCVYLGQNCNLQNNTLVTLRTFCNFFSHPTGEELMYQYRRELLENIVGISARNKNIEIGLATFLLNMVILSHRRDDEIGILLLANVLPDTIVNLNDPEAQFRALTGLGTLFSLGSVRQRAQVISKILENEKFTRKVSDLAKQASSNAIEIKRNNCANQIQNAMCKR